MRCPPKSSCIPELQRIDFGYARSDFDSVGNLFANWPITAYGKSLSTAMGGDDALHRAVVLAMPDAVALIIMRMDEVTGISSINRVTLSSVAARPGPKLPDVVMEETQASASENTIDETA